MSKVLCLVLSFIIGASAYQTLEAKLQDNAFIQNRENAIATLQHNETENIHMEHGSKGKKGQGNGSDSSQTYDGTSVNYNNLSQQNNISSKLNAINYTNIRDEKKGPFAYDLSEAIEKLDNEKLSDIANNVEKTKRRHLDAEHELSMTTVNAWDKMSIGNLDAADLTKQVMASKDLVLINHAVNSMDSNAQDKIKDKSIKIPKEAGVTHLFPDKEKVKYEELVNKHDQLRESYTVAMGAGDTEYANHLKKQMDELGRLAGELVSNVKGATLDIKEMHQSIDREEAHANKVKENGPTIDWSQLSAKDQLLLQSKHLQETFDKGLNTDDDERYAASKEILERAVALNDYDSLKLIRENTKNSEGAFGTGIGATEHSKKILEQEVKDENGNTHTVKDLEEKIEALREEAKNDNFSGDKQKELDKYVALYGKALNKYAEDNKSGGRWWTKIPAGEFEAAEHQNEHINTFRRENTMAAHYNNKTNANASGETSSNN